MNEVVLFDNSQSAWLRFQHPLEVVATRDIADVQPILNQLETAVHRWGWYAAGFITYEAAPAFDPAYRVHPASTLPLLWFGLYRQPQPLELSYPETVSPYAIGTWTPNLTRSEYEQALDQIKAYIACGDTYQVNYTLRLRADFSGDPWGFFLKLTSAQQGRYGAYVDTGRHVICSASPELFFQRSGLQLETRPMKGTAKRGLTLEADRQHMAWLHHSEKNRAENVMIVDMIRNDLSLIADLGTVKVPRLFQVERYPTVLQMTSTVTAQSEASTAQVMAALFPCASITGAPKVRTTEIIAELETEARGIYTGCIGFMAPGRQAQFNVAIRTVMIDRLTGQAEYGVGGGIVWDSSSADEYAECQLKAQVLMTEQPQFELLETILWEPLSGYFLRGEHLERLANSAEYFGFAADPSIIVAKLEAVAATFEPAPQRVRLLVGQAGTITVQAVPLSQTPLPQPYRVALAAEPVNSQDRFLYHKTTQRRVYEQARAARPGFDDVLLWNERGEVTETTITNVVAQFGDELVTPPLRCGLLAGVYRSELLAQSIIQERVIKVAELKQADKIYLINSVRKWIEPVLVE
jgi:para-aminobenzoate synthetase/4-amino-4-deoxychorismate lyase